MLGSHLFSNIGWYLLPLVEEKNLVPSLVSLIEKVSEVLRGKSLVFVALLCKNENDGWKATDLCLYESFSSYEQSSFVSCCSSSSWKHAVQNKSGDSLGPEAVNQSYPSCGDTISSK
ncbi:hypothetical protein V6N11_018872 [Hibiscus sabdariffa]|uniref:Uncharacterized protein n=1 Tax=Hibiscus sabdariffa TaxID=183260 RepID=A0ABR2N6G6_9ROSI